MKIRILSIVMLAITTLTSCIHEFPVTDHSFDFTGEVLYDADSDQHRLTLICRKKSEADQYNIAFRVDGENVITLTDMSGTIHQDWLTESFNETDSHTYVLSEAPVGLHKIDITISTDNFCQSMELRYEVTKQKYEIHCEVSTVGAECSTLLMSLSEGDPKYVYAVSVKHGESELTTEKIDFANTPIHSIDLPETIRPGVQSLTLFVSDGMTGKQYDIDFEEPIRHPEIPIILSHDDKSGFHIATIGYNPYGIRLEFSVFLDIRGKSSYYHEEERYWWRNPEYSYILEKDERTISENGSDCSINLTDRDGIAKSITSQWETSYIWGSTSTPGGGEDSGEDYTYITGSMPAFYQIYYETLSIDISSEPLPGISLKVTNNIGNMTINGEASTSGTSITIP